MLRRYIGLISFLEVRWTCAHAEEALDLLDAQFADLLFVDLKTVPVQPGSAFHTLIRKHSNVIVTSAYPASQLNAALPVIAVLHKPVAFEKFLEAVQLFLAAQE